MAGIFEAVIGGATQYAIYDLQRRSSNNERDQISADEDQDARSHQAVMIGLGVFALATVFVISINSKK